MHRTLEASILVLALATVSSAYYSNELAHECYSNVEGKCGHLIHACSFDGRCADELSSYQKCTIPQSEAEKNDIFNGHCFREWWNEANHTRALIDCMAHTCDLSYNSVVAEDVLATCTQLVLAESYVPCEEECMREIKEKVGARIKDTPIEVIYSQHFEDKEAQNFISLISKHCVSPGGRFRQLLSHQFSNSTQSAISTSSCASEQL